METNAVKTKTPNDATPQKGQQQLDSVPCPHCGGRAWFSSPIPDEKPCSCQACGGTGRVYADN